MRRPHHMSKGAWESFIYGAGQAFDLAGFLAEPTPPTHFLSEENDELLKELDRSIELHSQRAYVDPDQVARDVGRSWEEALRLLTEVLQEYAAKLTPEERQQLSREIRAWLERG